MNPTDLSQALGDGARGYDTNYGQGIARVTLPSTLRLSLTNPALGGLNDARLFSVQQITGESELTFISSPGTSTYVRYIYYLLSNPAELKSILIQTVTANVLAGTVFEVNRITPFGAQVVNEIPVQSFQTAQDFQNNRVNVPLSAIMDGHTFLTISTPPGAETIQATFFFGDRAEVCRNLALGEPLAVGATPAVVTAAPSGRLNRL